MSESALESILVHHSAITNNSFCDWRATRKATPASEVNSRWRSLNMSEAAGYWANETIQAFLNTCSAGPSPADISISTQKRRRRYQMDYVAPTRRASLNESKFDLAIGEKNRQLAMGISFSTAAIGVFILLAYRVGTCCSWFASA